MQFFSVAIPPIYYLRYEEKNHHPPEFFMDKKCITMQKKNYDIKKL
jgi:hypothetical protein